MKDYVGIAQRYAKRALDGEEIACKWVQLACERQTQDLKRPKWEFEFDHGKASRICRFLEALPHVKGRWGSRTIVLEPWQIFVLTTVFGWVDSHGNRRFREAYTEVARKNAKTTVCAGVELYLAFADGEPGAEVVSAATTKDQATLSFEIARSMCLKSQGLVETLGIEVGKYSIYRAGDSCYLKAVASDANTLDGLNLHGAIVDEFHAHKTRDVYDVLKTATGSRMQALLWIITTAGFDRASACYEQRNYMQQILEGRVTDNSTFGAIYTLDEDDDWRTPGVWAKSNPNLGVSVLVRDITDAAKQAEHNTGSRNAFLTKRMNIWTQSQTAYFNMLAWRELCRRPDLREDELFGKRCIFGVDFASKFDLAALIKLYELQPEVYAVFGRYYIPEAAIEKGKPNYDLYSRWANEGRLVVTPGPTMDGEFVDRDVRAAFAAANPEMLCYDPYQMWELSKTWGIEFGEARVIEVPQNVRNISEPMKELSAMIVRGDIVHDGDPVLSWMLGNVRGKEDANENVMPVKDSPMAKIDGVSALLNALHRYMVSKQPDSIYNRGAFAI